MNGTEPASSSRAGTRHGDVWMEVVSAGLFLYVGFGLGLVGISGDALYDGSVTALVWGSRVVGIGILAVIVLTYARVPGVGILDLVLSSVAAAGCLLIGLIWLVNSDLQGILLVLFGVVNASAARGAWSRWRGAGSRSAAERGPPGRES